MSKPYPTFSSLDSTAQASTMVALKTLLPQMEDGDILFIPAGGPLNFGSNTLTIPDGVTIASSRGLNGSPGGILKRSTPGASYGTSMLIAGGDNIRLTGLILEGEMYAEDFGNGSPIPGSQHESGYITGFKATGRTGIQVDNCEGRGFAWSFISVRGCPTAGRPRIHHNYIHHNQARGEGYGIDVQGGDCLIEANIFDYNRHSVTGTGWAGECYEVRYNVHLGHGHAIGAFHFDIHQDGKGGAFAGKEYHIHHNTILNGGCPSGQCCGAVHVRHKPTVGCFIENNRFDLEWPGTNEMGFSHVIAQSNATGNVFCKNNLWADVVYPDNLNILGRY